MFIIFSLASRQAGAGATSRTQFGAGASRSDSTHRVPRGELAIVHTTNKDSATSSLQIVMWQKCEGMFTANINSNFKAAELTLDLDAVMFLVG